MGSRLLGYRARCLSEMLGTYTLVLVGPSSVVLASLTTLPAAVKLFAVAAVFGLTVACLVIALAERSGANINPGITVATLAAGSSEERMFLPYVISQVIGGVAAGLTLEVIFESLSSSDYLGSTKLAAGVSPVEGTVLEVLGTFVLAMSALFASTIFKAKSRQAFFVGGTLFILILLIGPFTGASFNPARSLGPSLFSGYFDSQWVYWVGPLLGGACAGLIFRHYGKAQ